MGKIRLGMAGALALGAMALGGSEPAAHPEWTPDPDRYMPAATGTHWPSGFTQTYVAGLNYQCSKLFFGSPDYPTNDFLIPFVGFGCTEGSLAPQETVLPNGNIEIDEVFFIDHEGVEHPALFGASASATVVASTGIVYAQLTLPEDLPARSIFGIRTVWHGAVGQTYIGGYRCQRHRSEKYWAATDLASVRALALANGASTPDRDTFYNLVGNVSNSQPLAYGPAMVLAKGWDGRPVPLVVNDSLYERQEVAQSATARRVMGVWGRWLDEPDPVWGSYVPLVLGVAGAKSAQELATSATKRWAMIDAIRDTYNGGKNIWTMVLDQSGRNDNNATASTWANFKFGLVDRIKTRYGAGIHVVGATLWPTVTSTTAARTMATYGVATLWNGVSGTLKAVNDLILASSRYAKTIDVFPYFTMDDNPALPPAADSFPLGNIVGHPGNQDGVTTWDTMRFRSGEPIGSQVTFEYQPGLWATRTLMTETPLGGGVSDYTVLEIFATNVQDNATLLGKAMNLDSGSGTTTHVHPLVHTVLRTFSRFPQSQKAKLYP